MSTELATKIVDWISNQKYGGEEILHAIICCDFASRRRFIAALAEQIGSAEDAILAARGKEKDDQIEALSAALDTFGGHSRQCPAFEDASEPCECGYTCEESSEELARRVLYARDKAQRRAGAVEALRSALDDCESVVYADLVSGVAVGERKLLDRIGRIERGEVEL